MSFFELKRVPEPEVMDDSAEVKAYSSAAAQAHLDKIDDTFVEHALQLLKSRERGRALDIGTGPGQIVLKLANQLKLWKFVGVDRSANMIAKARENAAAAVPPVVGRVEFQVADGNRLDFPDASFDFVMCNSVLHHLEHPENLFAEVARLARRHAAILIRDLRRPSRLACPLHIRWHGRQYQGKMYELYCASVRSAYTKPELQSLLEAAPITGAHVFVHSSTHLGVERPAIHG